jgi:hypothetical protein
METLFYCGPLQSLIGHHNYQKVDFSHEYLLYRSSSNMEDFNSLLDIGSRKQKATPRHMPHQV